MEDTIRMNLVEHVPAPGAACHQAPGCTVIENSEKEVLVELAEGFSNKEIASRLGLSVRAVEARRERLMRKLRIRGVALLTQFAVSQGLVLLD